MELVDLPNLSTKRIRALNHTGITNIRSLLNFFPRRYIDRTTVKPIRTVYGKGEEVMVTGKVTNITLAGYGRKKRLEVTISDEQASMKGVWFKGVSYMKKYFKEGEQVAFFGKAKQYGRSVSMAHPDVEKINSADEIENIARIIPIYPGNKFLSNTHVTNKLIRRWIQIALKHTDIHEFLPNSLLQKHSLPKREDAYRMIHIPESEKEHRRALHRFKYEELFLFQLSMARIKTSIQKRHKGQRLSDFANYTTTFFNQYLPFELTGAQKTALSDIKTDFRSGRQMNRLLQGDVGSGKTIVALGAILMALDNGYQAAFMAPTEILAEQHFHTLKKFLKSLDINIRLLVGNQKTGLRTDILTEIEGGRCQIVVGTHAIIQENVRFHKLGLAVIDEQHRFGVQQRAEILQKGAHPHVLVMSATPIPRSLAMTMYSDLDISVMDELPGGRKPVKTAIRSPRQSASVYRFVEDTLREGGQAYVVYPLVEESEKVDLKDATAGYEKLKNKFTDFSVGLLHGQMKSEEKEAVMQQFIDNEIQILVSTTVIEVGVDVPNANIMIIHHAERFGLSQLHQLRGRIGRGERQSYCILLRGQNIGREARFRLKKMAQTNDGFEIAEADLQLRG
ncbi:MAG TPA: ATP-dependent DNA helicase RecG, partial [Balneolaceae bacterium]|nr:ATP-dependent DNA helicase RecG [Balneolaceae bacterium]